MQKAKAKPIKNTAWRQILKSPPSPLRIAYQNVRNIIFLENFPYVLNEWSHVKNTRTKGNLKFPSLLFFFLCIIFFTRLCFFMLGFSLEFLMILYNNCSKSLLTSLSYRYIKCFISVCKDDKNKLFQKGNKVFEMSKKVFFRTVFVRFCLCC